MSHRDDGARSWRLEELEPTHVAAFRAFQRASRPEDRRLRDDASEPSGLDPPLNPDLARRVYDNVEGTIDLVPGPNVICCVVIGERSGERIAGTTSTALAAEGVHGFISGGSERSVTFRGVLSAEWREVRIITGAGEAVAVPINADDAYWITVADPIEMVLSRSNGPERRICISRRGT